MPSSSVRWSVDVTAYAANAPVPVRHYDPIHSDDCAVARCGCSRCHAVPSAFKTDTETYADDIGERFYFSFKVAHPTHALMVVVVASMIVFRMFVAGHPT